MAQEKVYTSTSILIGTYDIEVTTDSKATYQDPDDGATQLVWNADTQQWELPPFTGGE